MNRELRILQANIKRGRQAQHALHNDPALADFHFILGQEPGCFFAEGVVVLHGTILSWTSFVPSGRRQGQYPVRTCIWASRDVMATQLQVDSADITAVVAHVGGRMLVIVSVYIPDLSSSTRTREENLEELSIRLHAIDELVQRERLRDPHTEVVVAGDFNRHNPMWGGSHIESTKTGGERANRRLHGRAVAAKPKIHEQFQCNVYHKRAVHPNNFARLFERTTQPRYVAVYR